SSSGPPARIASTACSGSSPRRRRIEMRVPGFAAEDSLHPTVGTYRMTAGAFGSELVPQRFVAGFDVGRRYGGHRGPVLAGAGGCIGCGIACVACAIGCLAAGPLAIPCEIVCGAA